MSGSGPVRAAELDLPTPRRRAVVEPPTPAPGGAATSAEGTVHAAGGTAEVPTEAHAALPADDPEATGAALDPVRLPDLADLPEATGLTELAELLSGAGAARGPAAGPDPTPDRSPTPTPTPAPAAPFADDTPTSPGIEITRTHSVWLWLWGPLLAATVIVSFLAGMAAAPVTVPSLTVAQPATVVDTDGRPLATIEPPAGAELVPADQLPDVLVQAVVAVQDPGYFSRSGLSAGDLVRAGAADLVRVRRHGSTIEERYARQVRIAAGARLPSLRESTVAARLAQKLSRRALLSRYVNGMYFGNGIYGVGAASRYYFGAPVATLDPAQVAMLVAIGDDPSHANPVTAPALAVAGQQTAIRAMRSAGLLTPGQAEAALREPIDARPHRLPERPSAAPDFAALIESSLLSRYGDDIVYGQALRVSTPLDLDLQTTLSGSIARLVPGNVPAVLAIASDPRTGDIRALVNRSSTSSASGPEGAGDVLFTRRPLGSLADALPLAVGDGRSASLGEVATTVGALATDGVQRDLRPLTEVTRPAQAGTSAATLDRADPVPSGRQLLPDDRARELSAGLRALARTRGAAAAGLPFQLTGVGGVGDAAPVGPVGADGTGTGVGTAAAAAPGPTAPQWYVGCVPDLCLTVWTGAGAPGPVDAGRAAPVGRAGLAGAIVVDALQRFAEVAPARVTLPALPRTRPPERRVADRPQTGVGSSAPVPGASAGPQPRATTRPSTRPTASAAPSAAATPSPATSAATGATDPGGTNAGPSGTSNGSDGAPVAQPGAGGTGGTGGTGGARNGA